jgi:hypothetical protein
MDSSGERQVVQLEGVGGFDETQLEAKAVGKGGDKVMFEAACRRALAPEQGRRCEDRNNERAVRLRGFDASAGCEAD